MGTYKEQGGKAPQGLTQGDYVVTGGGTYLIGGVGSGEGYTYKDANGNMRQVTMYNPNQTTYNYKGSYDSVPNISPAQQNAQATSPASSAWGQTGSGSNMQSGAVNTAKGTEGTTYVSNKGQGVLNYDNATGRLIRTMPNGQAWYVDPGEAKYNELYQEYYNTYGVDPRGMYAGTAANGPGTMQSAAGSMDAYIKEMQQLVNAMMSAQTPSYQAPDTSAQRAQLDQYLSQLGSIQYNPVDYNQYMEGVGTLDDYVQEAVNALTPGYKKQYDAAYTKAMQNLNRAGLVDSVYGQALNTQQQNAITDALMAEAGTMGLDLRQQAKDDAYRAYQAAVNENQFGTQLKSDNLSQAGSLTMNYIGLLNDQAKNLNDYNMQAYLSKMQQYTAAIDAAYQMGSLTSAEYENMISAAKLELSKVEAELTAAQVANTNADTDYIKAKTALANAELAGFSGATSGGGYGSGGYYSSGGDEGPDYSYTPTPVSKDDLPSQYYNNPARKTDHTGVPNYSYKDVLNEVNQQLANGETYGAGQTIISASPYLTTQQIDNLNNKVNDAEAKARNWSSKTGVVGGIK